MGHNFWLECPTKVISTQLSYILKALFSDTPLAYFFVPPAIWQPGNLAICHLATWSAKTRDPCTGPKGHLGPPLK